MAHHAPPSEIILHAKTKSLELVYGGQHYLLSAEYLRVYSPSAEVRGHGNPILQINKQQVAIDRLEPVGHYALKIVFNDGHDSGLFTWSYLYTLATEYQVRWERYLKKLNQRGLERES